MLFEKTAEVVGVVKPAFLCNFAHGVEVICEQITSVKQKDLAFVGECRLAEYCQEKTAKIGLAHVAKIARIDAEFEMPDPKSDPITEKLTDADKRQAAKSAVALDKLVEKYNLTGLAYYYEGREGTVQRELTSTFIVGNSILNAEGIPMCGEFDLKTCIAMLIMDRLDIGGSFAEFHPFDFEEDFILVGHDGPHHLRIADGKPILRSLKKYHGKPGHGAGVEFKIKEGPITMLVSHRPMAAALSSSSVRGIPRRVPSLRRATPIRAAFFEPTTREFVKKWVMEAPTHHYALGIGHHADKIRKIADILGIESVIVR